MHYKFELKISKKKLIICTILSSFCSIVILKICLLISDYYKSLLKCYRAIEGVIPHWYDVNYAYSGLHSIIHPPPNEVDIWGSIIIPIFQLNRNLAECEFCFDNYAEDRCQFYRPSKEFQCVPKLRRGKYIYCECCDFSDDELPIEENENIVGSGDHIENQLNVIDTNNDLSNNQDNDIDNKRLKITDTDTVTPKIQPGWYGKGKRQCCSVLFILVSFLHVLCKYIITIRSFGSY